MPAIAPKRLLLDLMTAAGERSLDVSFLVRAAGVFGIAENALRVALVRLRASGLVEAVARGEYRLGGPATSLQSHIQQWRDADRRVRDDWDGAWIGVHTGALPRTNRRVMRERDRALTLLGFRELSAGLQVRPDNLDGGVEFVRSRLQELGLGPEALVFRIAELDDDSAAEAAQLWDVEELHETYTHVADDLRTTMTRLGTLPVDKAVRESFIVGARALRRAVVDPLLPSAFVDASARHEFFDALRRFDTTARGVWSSFLDGASAAAPTRASFLVPRAQVVSDADVQLSDAQVEAAVAAAQAPEREPAGDTAARDVQPIH
jgi:phenylacetic acid degradation operon negative regulatory protein